jgi:hypothetical protein
VPRNVHPEVSRAKALVAVRTRDHAPPEAIEAARAQLAEANARARVLRVVAAWPPLSAETRAELAILLLSPAGGDHATT